MKIFPIFPDSLFVNMRIKYLNFARALQSWAKVALLHRYNRLLPKNLIYDEYVEATLLAPCNGDF